jgi:hypothetical protein
MRGPVLHVIKNRQWNNSNNKHLEANYITAKIDIQRGSVLFITTFPQVNLKPVECLSVLALIGGGRR